MSLQFENTEVYNTSTDMPNKINVGPIVFYIFIMAFIVIAYLNNNGFLSHLFQKESKDKESRVVQLGYKKKQYDLNFSNQLADTAIELSGFEDGEKWKGDFVTDDENYWEGKTSYVVSSKNNQPTILSLNKNIDLSNYQFFKILIYTDSEENTNNIKKLSLRFGNKQDTTYYDYDIRNLKTGWNIIKIAKDNFTLTRGPVLTPTDETSNVVSQRLSNDDFLWHKIEKISLELGSVPRSHVELSFDRLWTEKNDEYKKIFRTENFNMISPHVFKAKTYMDFLSLGGNLSLLSEVTSVKNFTYTAKIIPQKSGSFGINGRTDIDTGNGYYLELGGIGNGSWQLYKVGKVTDNSPTTRLDNGTVGNYQVEANQPVWLRISTGNDRITGYLSTDGINFAKLTEKYDSEIESGGIGLQTSNASFLLESVDFNQ